MSDGRKRLSGADYKKRAEIKAKARKISLEKTIKIDTFFNRPGPKDTDTLDTEAAISVAHTPSPPLAGSCNTDMIASTSKTDIVPLAEIPEINVTLVDFQFQDPAFWMTDSASMEQVLNLFKTQDLGSLDFEISKRRIGVQNRYCNKSIFYKKMKNGEKIRRGWLVYSKSTGTVLCMYCKLFSNSYSVFSSGFCDWKKAQQKCDQHETSSFHMESLEIYISRTSANVKKIDDSLRQELEHEKKYWRTILQRILSVIRFLASRGLPFRGTDEKFGSKCNGNYLGLLELLAEYDNVLKEHIFFLVETLKKNEHSTLVPKRLTVTRWSARFDSLKALKHSYSEIKQALLEISDNNKEKMTIRSQANGLATKFSTLEFAILVVFWYDVLERSDKVSKSLQSSNVNLDTCSSLYSSLEEYYESLRVKFDVYEKDGQLLSSQINYKEVSRKRKRKLNFGEADTEEFVTSEAKMRTQIIYKVLDNLVNELNGRGKAYKHLATTFSFLFSVPSLEEQIILDKAKILVESYPDDLDVSLASECVQLKYFIISVMKSGVVYNENSNCLMELLYKYNIISTFPNVEVALRMFLCLMVTNASGERSFSTLKRVKSYLRISMNSAEFQMLLIYKDVLLSTYIK